MVSGHLLPRLTPCQIPQLLLLLQTFHKSQIWKFQSKSQIRDEIQMALNIFLKLHENGQRTKPDPIVCIVDCISDRGT
ncbi:hypothetical protein BTVI_04114 [Pitangus sulphuratus]|nr:hypothetical protein BTVI_04114 [Pitangus sulphuratus]